MGPPTFLLLLLSGPLAPTDPWAGSHSLRLLETATSWPGLGEPWYFAVGYVDDTQFGRFDSDSPDQRVEVLAPWAEQVGQEDQEEETRNQRLSAQRLKALLEDLRGYYNQSRDGPALLDPRGLGGSDHPARMGGGRSGRAGPEQPGGQVDKEEVTSGSKQLQYQGSEVYLSP
ncbi:patr class I histocompatibility antigen, A-108 alpha chain-like [Talpa occidentalis]|uniref:patr class I histocompatibility antigen, A-108 alpha chain-like n=1 Tax=Talpa occidentalis TaxID=50954 RepID=UPI0023F86A57|nr:patr class I histocompatibility antigen, A-108 alpha chain-like [Talpa occidentalis]